MAPNIYLTVVS